MQQAKRLMSLLNKKNGQRIYDSDLQINFFGFREIGPETGFDFKLI
ncbi:MAG: hypothetical protein NVS1B13_20650 [Flavisolibacter sp.]